MNKNPLLWPQLSCCHSSLLATGADLALPSRKIIFSRLCPIQKSSKISRVWIADYSVDKYKQKHRRNRTTYNSYDQTETLTHKPGQDGKYF
jgi:hypothetical protein